MKLSSLALGIALTSAFAAAQSVVVPAGMDTTNPGTTTLAWRNSLFHFQMLYDQSHFLSQGINYPIVINRLQYRAGGGATSLGGDVYSGVTVQMSTSPSDWSTASTTFASNIGADVTTVFTGNVTSLAAAGTSPNTYIIDIPLATPFTYDPTTQQDLLIDVDAPNAPLPAGMPTMAASSNASHLARRISTTTAGGATGSLSYFACVVLMDFTPLPNAATAVPFGEGCVDKTASFYETFAPGAFDLAGTAGNPNSISLTPLAPGYVVSQGSTNWYTPTTTALAIGDDELTLPVTLPFTLNFPGGSTQDIQVCSNGFVYLDTTSTSTSAAGSNAGLLTFGPRLAPMWNDLDPSAGGAVYVDVDPVTNAVYVTWDQVPLFGVPTSLNTVQLAIFSDSSVEFRYQDCANGTCVTGFSPGNGARDPGSVDISGAIPFATELDIAPLALNAINRPKLGASFTLEVADFPAGASLGAVNFGFLQFNPGNSLAGIGAPGCSQYASIDAPFSFPVVATSQPFTLTMPSSPALAGLHIFAQAVSDAPSSNALGLVSSNGIDMTFDIN